MIFTAIMRKRAGPSAVGSVPERLRARGTEMMFFGLIVILVGLAGLMSGLAFG